MSQDTPPVVVDRVLRNRRTLKVASDVPLEAETDREVVEELLTGASWAPVGTADGPGVATGKYRDQRGETGDWSVWVEP